MWSASDGGGPIKCWDSERFKSSKDVNATSFVKGEVVTHMSKISNDTSMFISFTLYKWLMIIIIVWIGTMSGMIKIWTVPKKKMVHEMKVGMFPIWCMIAQESSSSVWVAHGDGILLLSSSFHLSICLLLFFYFPLTFLFCFFESRKISHDITRFHTESRRLSPKNTRHTSQAW